MSANQKSEHNSDLRKLLSPESRRHQRRRTALTNCEPEVVLVPAGTGTGTGEQVIHIDDNSDMLEPQAILFINDIRRRERLAEELARFGFRTVQVDDLVTAYAVVTRLIPEMIVIDPTMCFEPNWRDLEALRKFTRQQDCAMMVLLGDPSRELVERLAGLGVDHVSLSTDPLPVLAFTIRRIVLDKRELRQMRDRLPAEPALATA